ncbi:uncharacterized protein V6R79_006803 [Siganus canaliculatus]
MHRHTRSVSHPSAVSWASWSGEQSSQKVFDFPHCKEKEKKKGLLASVGRVISLIVFYHQRQQNDTDALRAQDAAA